MGMLNKELYSPNLQSRFTWSLHMAPLPPAPCPSQHMQFLPRPSLSLEDLSLMAFLPERGHYNGVVRSVSEEATGSVHIAMNRTLRFAHQCRDKGVKKELTSGMVLDNHTFNCLERCCCLFFFGEGRGDQGGYRKIKG